MRFGFRELVFIAVLLAVPIASYFYVFKPRNQEIQEAMDEMSVKRERLARLAELTAQIDDLELLIEEAREAIRVVVERLPSQTAIDTILQDVWSIADENGLVVKSVKSEKTVPAAGCMELPLRMTMEGEFDGFYKFMLELENLVRITRMPDLKLSRNMVTSRSPDGPRPAAMKAEFILSIYYETGSATALADS